MRWWSVLAMLALAIATGVALASWVYCLVAGRTAAFVFPYAQIIEVLPWARSSLRMMAAVTLGTIAGLIPTALALLLAFRARRPKRSLYGSSAWATQAQMQQGGLRIRRRPL